MLETIELPGSGRQTTRLGFGGSGLMGGLSERESLRLLETAFDAGIRHFDIAPSYGHGMGERCLGKFLIGRGDQVTVTTKYGILPPQRAGLLNIARNIARPLVQRLPSVRASVAQAAAALNRKARFSAEEAEQSLEHSLLDLGIGRIDLWLLHEATADDLDVSGLLPLLRKFTEQGRIGTYGLGTARRNLSALWQRHREYCRVLQFESSVLDEKPDFSGAFCIHHRSVSDAIGAIQNYFEHDAGLCRRWCDELDVDLGQPEILASLVLASALSANPNGIVLFSSRKPAHIQANVRAAADPARAVRSRRFLELLRQH
jgi:D-threo-aldose 1-dehydrogenase